jgi:predicted ferric reductase
MRKQNLGNWGIAALVAINLFIWLVFTPHSNLYPNYPMEVVAEILSSSAVILFSCGLLLSNRPRVLEPYFGGLDKMYVTHKTIATLAVILIVFHQMFVPKTGIQGPGLWAGMAAFAGILAIVLLTIGPRVPLLSQLTRFTYDGWLKIHRFVGLFFIFGFAHMFMVEPLLLHSPALTVYIVTIASIGTLAYLYKELVWERLRPYRMHTVENVRKLNGTTLEVVLKPNSKKLDYRAGQFLFVYFEGDKTLREPHPFTISSAPKQDNLRLSIKASGDWTGYLHEALKPGMRACVDGPYGLFNYKPGAAKQVWVAGGIGITPFLSWMRDFNGNSPHEIDFFYTVAFPGEALFLDEIEQAAAHNKNFRAHVSYTSEHGRLSAKKIIETSGAVDGKDIYLCGPIGMTMAFREAFIEQGLSAANIHYEEFNFR